MKKSYFNSVINISFLRNKFHIGLLLIFIISANCQDSNKIIKFKKDGNIVIYNKKDDNITKTHLYSPLIYIKINENNINFKDNNIFPVENGYFTCTIPDQDISLLDISYEEFTLNSHLILKNYPNLLFNTNKTFSLFSININNGYLSKYEKYKSNFLEKNNFNFIKGICPEDRDEILFLRIDYFIQMRYTYEFKNNILNPTDNTNMQNDNIIWLSHLIKIIPIYPNIISNNNDIYENKNENDDNYKFFEKDDFYIYEINDNETISVIYSQDNDLNAEINDIQNDFNFNNYYFGNKIRDKLFQNKIMKKDTSSRYIFIKFPKTFIFAFVLLLLMSNFIRSKIKEHRNKITQENKNENIIIQTEQVNIEVKENKNNEIVKKKKLISPSLRAKSITNLNIFYSIEKNEAKPKNKEEKNLNRHSKIKSLLKNFSSSKKKDLFLSKKTSYRKSFQIYKKKKTPATIDEKNTLNLLFNTYLEDIKNNNNNESSINLNLKTISIKDKYKKLYSLLEDTEKSINSSNTIEEFKDNKINIGHQNFLRKEFQNNFNYVIDSGRLLKEFKDFHFIGKGGFGVVLKASNILDEGQWAIKIMRINLDLKKAKELNAIQEIKMMSKFKKKNIVRYKTCWFEFAQNDQIDTKKSRERSASLDNNKEDSGMNDYVNPKIFEKIKVKENRRKNSVYYERDKDKEIMPIEEKEEDIKVKNNNHSSFKPKIEKIKPPKKRQRATSSIWDDDDDFSDDSLGADKNYVIKEEGKNINLDDNNEYNDEEDENSGEEEDEENYNYYYGENKEIIKEENYKKEENMDSIEDSSDEYNNLRFQKKESKIHVNESSSNIIYSNSNNSISENKKKSEEENDNEQNNKKINSKLIIYFFIQMEYCSGCSMNYYLSHRKTVPSKSLTSYMFFQMCYAVKHIHEANIIHRDLKPGNIFIMKDYLIKIGDFGLALNFGKTKNEQGGTYLYQSPEQIQNKIYDQKVDIFALGVILVELVSQFDSQFERVEVLQGLKNNSYPDYLEKDHLNEYNLIKKMTRLNADERPNIQDIFNDIDFIELINSQ